MSCQAGIRKVERIHINFAQASAIPVPPLVLARLTLGAPLSLRVASALPTQRKGTAERMVTSEVHAGDTVFG